MAVQYVIIPNLFKKGEFIARTAQGAVFSFDAITGVTRGAALTESEIHGVVYTLAHEFKDCLYAAILKAVKKSVLSAFSFRPRYNPAGASRDL